MNLMEQNIDAEQMEERQVEPTSPMATRLMERAKVLAVLESLPDDAVIGTGEAAVYLDMSEKQITRLFNDGLIEGHRFGTFGHLKIRMRTLRRMTGTIRRKGNKR